MTGNPMFGGDPPSFREIRHDTVGPGTVATPRSFMVRRAVALSPIDRICCGVGPMKTTFER